jgi:NADH:ubiquinone oxidoreductase subunit F (NADH-binding)
MKWGFVPMGPDARQPKYFIVNADEMEPGAFKDRFLLEGDPHQIVEGVILSAYALQAAKAFIFLRQGYSVAKQRLKKAIDEAAAAAYLGRNIMKSGFSLDLRVHTSAGRYICGEETALINALEGRRAVPRSKPPFPQICGLWGRPTVVNNVETVANIPHIVNNGPDWFRSLSMSPDSGTKIYGVSGRVKRPGAWELPMGTTVRELIEEHAGGMQDGYRLRGLLPGGGSLLSCRTPGCEDGFRPCGSGAMERAPSPCWMTGPSRGFVHNSSFSAGVRRLVHPAEGLPIGKVPARSSPATESRRISVCWSSSAGCSGPARPSARWLPARSNRSRAR